VSRVTVDKATGALRVAGAKAFPLGLSDPPPLDDKAPKPLLQELSSTAVPPALVGKDAKPQVKSAAKDVEVLTRREGRFLDVLAVRRGGATSRVGFTGPPKKLDGRPLTDGQVLFESVQEPPLPPVGAGRQAFRSVGAAAGGFRDWLGPRDARVDRFSL
jgi:hypothetical protein